MKLSGALAIILFYLVGSMALAVEWKELSTDEQQVLLPFADEWDALSVDAQERMRRGAQRWAAMDSVQRSDAESRLGRWQQLAPNQRQRLRERYRKFRELPPERQRALRQVYRQFQQLPPKQRQQFRQRFEQMSDEEKEAFVRGTQLQRQGTQSQRRQFFDRLPRADRRALRAIAGGLSQSAKEGLWSELRQRDKAERAQLIEQLQAMSMEQREEFLRSPAELDR